jgi:Domain of unknown function (DUF222)/HNH endonuclease
MHERGVVVSELRSVIEAFRAESVSELPDARVEEDFAELQRAVELLDAERLRRLAEIDRRRLYERDGHLSAASWLAAAHRMTWGHAREHVRVARAVGDMPRTVRAFDAGDISMSAVRVLATAHDVHPEAFARSEAQLVDAARRHSASDLHRVVAVWRDHAERDRADGRDTAYERRRLHASRSLGGMVRIDGDLDPETEETVLTALHAVLDTDARSRDRGDRRSPAQRRADGLGEICRQWLDRGDRPVVAGERPHLTLTIPARELGASSVATGELDHAGPVPAATARRLACDAAIMRIVLSARSEPLDVGRRTSVVPPSLRRAVVVRDGGCRFPGCDRPPPWCDAHHVDHWADGGATSLANLLLLCRRHHRLVHRPGGFDLRTVNGRPVFRRPDGSVLEGRAPQ